MQTPNKEQNMEKYPKVLVGCPTSEHKKYAIKRYMMGLKKINYPNFDILIVDNSKSNEYLEEIKALGLPAIKGKYHESARERIIKSRNLLREKALNYDYFLSLEQDVIPPEDIIQRMLKHNKEIITAIYFGYNIIKGEKKLVPFIWERTGKEKVKYIPAEKVMGEKLIEVGACGLGCILIHKNVLKDIEFRYEKEKQSFDDMFFCQDANQKGYKIYADTSIKCRHLVKGWGWEGIKI